MLSVIAGIDVLSNPIREPVNTLAGLSYFAGAGGCALLGSWWPLLAGWIFSLVLQGVSTSLLVKGAFNEQVNEERAKRGLPPIENDGEDNRGAGL